MNRKQILGGLEMMIGAIAMPLGVGMSAASNPAGIPVTLAGGVLGYDGFERLLYSTGPLERAWAYVKSKISPKCYAASIQ